jgi:hypothetical protein
MRLPVLAAASVLSTLGIGPSVYAAGQPQLGSQESAAATSGKTPDQAEKSRMETKSERDTQKYQGQGAPSGNHPAGQTGSDPAAANKH